MSAALGAVWLGHGLAVLCGALVGFALALTGGGGSILAVPLLLYVVGLRDAHLVIGTSALAVSINAYANLVPHARAGHVRWRAAFLFTAAGVVGAFAGSELGKWMDGRRLIGLFAVLMLVVAALMARPRRRPASAGRDPAPPRAALRLSGIGLGTGTLAGFFGIGGGFLTVPGLMLATRMQIIDAIGTSLFGVGSFGLATAVNYARSGLVDWSIATLFVLGGIGGGWGGARLARHLSTRRNALQRVFAAMIFLVGCYMLVRAIRGA